MDLAKSILYIYPHLNPNEDFLVMDNLDGKGSFIKEWNAVEVEPSKNDLLAAWESYQANPPSQPLSPQGELEKLKKQQELMQSAIDDLIFSGGGL